MWDSVFQTLFTEAGQMVGSLVNPNTRLFFGYTLSAALLAVLVWAVHEKQQRSFKGMVKYLFNPRIWWHTSAKLDYRLFVINRVVRLFIWAPVLLTMVPIAIGLSDGLEAVFGQLQPLSTNPVTVTLWFTLLLFLFDDFTRFLLHLAMHKIPALWEFHKVHHSAQVLTPMTVYRSHPLESFLYATRMALAQGAAVGVSYYFFGPTLSMLDILGANMFIFVFNMAGSNLRHSHVYWKWGNTIEKWFISPAQHQIHHSTNPVHFDKNFGTTLAVWDRLFNSLVLSSTAKRLRFGLGGREASHRSVADAYIRPFRALFKRRKPISKQTTPDHTTRPV
ncbi:sterol desaturase family protein [Alteromonas sp. ASW11-19]|uniref:Sterol desaturase family protein n=1 Tax=Alteromonas salexigens TaxID=2982530 RepID=A0ABT2VU24_9ALTE|nr:sterol desaturase family protein [Alteromonas salexigens]MCU7555359.1 sterol desaturase family protein [Alteromonas salexigens]